MLSLYSLKNEFKEILTTLCSRVCFDEDQLTCDVNNATLSVQFSVSIDENMDKFDVETLNQIEGIRIESECFETAEREKVLQAARDFKSKYIKG